MPKDYLGMRVVEKGDKKDHGIKGQKWGIRRSPTQLKSAKKTTEVKTEVKKTPTSTTSKTTVTKSAPKPEDTTPFGQETSQAKYARLKAQAKENGPSSLSDADLKFVNSRTEALAKVAKLTETKPTWLQETTRAVLKNAAQRQMQTVANEFADKYIGRKIATQLRDNSKAIAAESKTAVDYVGKHRAKK